MALQSSGRNWQAEGQAYRLFDYQALIQVSGTWYLAPVPDHTEAIFPVVGEIDSVSDRILVGLSSAEVGRIAVKAVGLSLGYGLQFLLELTAQSGAEDVHGLLRQAFEDDDSITLVVPQLGRWTWVPVCIWRHGVLDQPVVIHDTDGGIHRP